MLITSLLIGHSHFWTLIISFETVPWLKVLMLIINVYTYKLSLKLEKLYRGQQTIPHVCEQRKVQPSLDNKTPF